MKVNRMQILRLDQISDGKNDPAMKEYFIGPSFVGEHPSDAALMTFRNSIRHPEAEQVFDWWLSLCRDGLPPKKSDLTMRDMGRFASNIGLVLVSNNRTTQIRLAGHSIEDLIGKSLTGLETQDVAPVSEGLCQLSWQTQIIERRVRYYRRDLRHVDRAFREVGILELPLLDSRNSDQHFVLSHMVRTN